MMLSLLLYCSNVFVDMSPNKKQQFEKIQMRCLKSINAKRNSARLSSINHSRNKLFEVFKCLDGISTPDYEKYFKRLDYCKGTQGNDQSLLFPKVKSEADRKIYAFMGTKIFNTRPSNMKTESSIAKFKTACKDFNFDHLTFP